MIILQPCPICRSKARRAFRTAGWRNLGWIDWVITCELDPSHARVEGGTEEEAATKWNSYKSFEAFHDRANS